MQLARIDTAGAAAVSARPEPELSLVPTAAAGERAHQLLQNARAAALEHLEGLRQSICETRGLAAVVVDGGDLYAVGVLELARRMSEDLDWRARTLEALIERQREAAGVRRATFRRAGS
jgi:hypothetical protein